MALVREYEVPSTGLVAPNAYHVIKKITTEKDKYIYRKKEKNKDDI